MLTFNSFGPAERLHTAIRRRAPQVAAAVVRDDETGLSHVRITYRQAGPLTADWDGTAYRWRHGDGPYESLPADPEQAADAIAAELGVRIEHP
ncbi:hypothetical protein D0T12_13625 [Actinomadura spongiicola]|uniref:Uncharacterized protein n=1 Tax=Actinomadura spongiicola TaxID=2303421 RepID=A0A372GGT6_9ACTN|nr:hypothetical protein [Actinomadura spongiicola]RFS84588.1 hypothetical protein D0T12_13625 [Actinomadura spongiicola]